MSSFPVVPELRGLRIVVLGDYVADAYVFGETDRISREAPVPIVRFEREELRLGAAANVAHNLAALGATVLAVGVVGKDGPGRYLRQACKAAKMDVSGLIALSGVATAVKTRVLAGAPHTTRQQLLRLDRGEEISPDQAGVLKDVLSSAARTADAILVSDYGLGSAGPWVAPLCERIARRTPVLVDSRFHLGAFRGVTLAKPNTPELLALGGATAEADLAAVARRVLRAQRLSALLVTRGRDGMTLFAKGAAPLELAAFGPRDAVNVTGAGDTVLATFAAVFARSGDLALAARLANVAGGLVVQKPGTAVVTQTELAAAWGAAR